MAPIILPWKKFGTMKTPPRAGHSAKLSTQKEKGLSNRGDQEPMVNVAELQILCAENGRSFQIVIFHILL